ncbi:carboxymuconolactone decarboxylase family protein [Terricaulis sp.]|uniref:carboxymuconolactone decarboxylase family protein n=1 Tax=Terricaulis sp. TaxID=2768686 RepID=UPI0037842CDB
MAHVLTPLQPPFPAEVAEILKTYPQQGGYLLTLFRTFANSVRFLKKGVVNLLDAESPLSLRQREIVILRVTANLDCEYEWGVHAAAFAKRAELTEQQVAATCGDADAQCWTAEERLLLRAIDELCDEARISEPTLLLVQQAFTREQQLEVLALAGNYHTVSFVANSAKLAPEAFAARFPA